MSLVLNHFLVILGFLLAIVLAAKVLQEDRPPTHTLAWLLAIVLMPYVGVPLYLLFGGRKIKKFALAKPALQHPEASPPLDEIASPVERLCVSLGSPQARSGNDVRLLVSGEEAFASFLQEIENARTRIHITTYILGNDEVGQTILAKLVTKVKAGVEVRLLLDGFGMLARHRKLTRALKAAGGKVGIFLPVLPLQSRWSLNLRNHRKLAIFDDKIAFVGGRNLSFEYLGPTPTTERWADFTLRLSGPAVADLVSVFASDWEFATYEQLAPTAPPAANDGVDRVQIVASGPDTATDSIQGGVLASITGAKKRIWIVTPYFIPDETLFQTLCLVARLGKDVRLIVPARSNHPVADFARGSYLRQLRASGVKIYYYPLGMVHTKLIVVDEDIAIAGSANFDIRSLYVNYELAALLYSPATVQPIAQHILALIAKSQVPMPEYKGLRSVIRYWFEAICRLVAPIL